MAFRKLFCFVVIFVAVAFQVEKSAQAQAFDFSKWKPSVNWEWGQTRFELNDFLMSADRVKVTNWGHTSLDVQVTMKENDVVIYSDYYLGTMSPGESGEFMVGPWIKVGTEDRYKVEVIVELVDTKGASGLPPGTVISGSSTTHLYERIVPVVPGDPPGME